MLAARRRLPRRGAVRTGRGSRPCLEPIRSCATCRRCSEVIARGDDQVLRGAVSLLEERGHRVVGVHELAPDLVAPPTSARRAARRARTIGTDRLSASISSVPCRPSTSARRAVVARPACSGDRRTGRHRPHARRVRAQPPILVSACAAAGRRRPDQGGQARPGSARRHAGHRPAHHRRGGPRRPVRHRGRRRLDPRARPGRDHREADRSACSSSQSNCLDGGRCVSGSEPEDLDRRGRGIPAISSAPS